MIPTSDLESQTFCRHLVSTVDLVAVRRSVRARTEAGGKAWHFRHLRARLAHFSRLRLSPLSSLLTGLACSTYPHHSTSAKSGADVSLTLSSSHLHPENPRVWFLTCVRAPEPLDLRQRRTDSQRLHTTQAQADAVAESASDALQVQQRLAAQPHPSQRRQRCCSACVYFCRARFRATAPNLLRTLRRSRVAAHTLALDSTTTTPLYIDT